MKVWLLILTTMVGGCAGVRIPMQPFFTPEPLPVSGTAAVVPAGYVDAMSGYMRGNRAEIAADTERAASAYLQTLAEDSTNTHVAARAFEMALLEGDVANAYRLARTMPLAHGQTMPALVRAVVDIETGRLNDAQMEITRAATVAPDLLQFKLLQSYLAIAQGEKVDAEVAKLAQLASPAPLRARTLYHMARLQLNAGDDKAAKQLLIQSNRLEPSALFTTLLLGSLEERGGNRDIAQRLYRDFRIRNWQAPLLVDEEKEALTRTSWPLLKPTTLRQNAALTLFDFGLMVWAQGALAPARELMNLALWLDATNPYILYYAGIVDEFGGVPEKAQRKYRLINADASTFWAGQLRMANLVGEHDAAAARDMLDELIEKRPDISQFHQTLGELAFNVKDYPTALAAYDRVLTRDKDMLPPPVLAVLYFARGATYERLKKYDAAASDLGISLTLNPLNASVLNYLGYMWVEQGKNLPEAMTMLQKALQLAPEDGAIVDSLGWAYYMMGDYTSALQYLEKALEMTPDDPSVNEHVGDVYAKLGRMPEARRQWERALALVKDDVEFKNRLMKKVR